MGAWFASLLDGPTNATRREIIKAVPLLVAAPAIVRVANLMPISAFKPEVGMLVGTFNGVGFYADSLGAELAAITRRAFVPQVSTQITTRCPTLALLWRRATDRRLSVSPTEGLDN